LVSVHFQVSFLSGIEAGLTEAFPDAFRVGAFKESRFDSNQIAVGIAHLKLSQPGTLSLLIT